MKASNIIQKAIDSGYTPVAGDGKICISFEGKSIKPIWFWTGKLTEYENGQKQIRTASVNNLREAGRHILNDGWIATQPISDELLRAMENELRQGKVPMPDGEFLQNKEIPSQYLGTDADTTGLKVKTNISDAELEAFRKTRIGN